MPFSHDLISSFFRGGDQGIFVTKKLWDTIGGYKKKW
jgi:hypothetical protein